MITWKEIQSAAKFGETEVATGYFARLKNYIKLDYEPVAICGGSPFWYKRLEYKKLAPKREFFYQWKDGKIDNDEYVKQYHEQVLGELDPKKVIEELRNEIKSDKIVLLCYEKPFDFCHRHIISHWLSNETDLTVNELDYKIGE